MVQASKELLDMSDVMEEMSIAESLFWALNDVLRHPLELDLADCGLLPLYDHARVERGGPAATLLPQAAGAVRAMYSSVYAVLQLRFDAMLLAKGAQRVPSYSYTPGDCAFDATAWQLPGRNGSLLRHLAAGELLQGWRMKTSTAVWRAQTVTAAAAEVHVNDHRIG